MQNNFYFSIVVCTVNNYRNIKKFLYSVKNQTFINYELILIDQSKENKRNILTINKISNLKYIKSHKFGLSFNRNLGIKIASGKYLMFLDDDCYFDKFFLQKLYQIQNINKFDILGFQIRNYKNKNIIVKNPLKIISNNSPINITRSLCSSNFIIKYNRNMFDARLGLGAKFLSKSSEDTDYLLRVSPKYKIYYSKKIVIYHPEPNYYINIKKNFFYGVGFSVCMLKNKNFLIIFLILLKIPVNVFFNFFSLKFTKIINSSIKFLGIIYGLFYFIFYKKSYAN